MATGLYLTPDGMVVVDYGKRKIPMSPAKYKANGYKPSYEKLMDKPRGKRRGVPGNQAPQRP